MIIPISIDLDTPRKSPNGVLLTFYIRSITQLPSTSELQGALGPTGFASQSIAQHQSAKTQDPAQLIKIERV